MCNNLFPRDQVDQNNYIFRLNQWKSNYKSRVCTKTPPHWGLQWKRIILATELSTPDRWESTSAGEEGEGRSLSLSYSLLGPCGPQVAPLDSLAFKIQQVSARLLSENPVTEVIFRFASRPRSRVALLLSFRYPSWWLKLMILHCAQFGPYLH